jgi:lysophospholipase L1-like esterase
MKQALLFVFIIFVGCSSAKDPITIYTIGDSTMADKKQEVYPETGWCQVLDNYFNETVTVRNYAVNGRSSKSFIDEGRWQTVLDSLNPGDLVFVQFGHNDQKENDTTRFANPFGSYSDNLEKFLRETRSKGASPILFTSIIRRKFGENGKLSQTLGDYPRATRRISTKFDVPLIDLHKLTEEWINNLGDEPSKIMYLHIGPNNKYPEGKKDDTHLSFEGANKVTQLAIAEMKKQKLKISDRLK